METTLHRQLKALYSSSAEDRQEVTVDGFRIDAIADDRLIEIQCASLGAIRKKVSRLLRAHRIDVVKPLIARKVLVKRERRGGAVISRRASPRHETIFDVFSDLVYFTGPFPHSRLSLEVLLLSIEEHRLPRRARRWRGKDYRVQDRKLVDVVEKVTFRTPTDLLKLLPAGLTEPFSTQDLAVTAGVPRWLAQKAAYCLRKAGAVLVTGKRRNSILYQRVPADELAA